MHLVVPFAAPSSEAGRATLATLELPGLSALLAGREPERDDGDEWSLSPPHERVLARAFGWAGGDGRLPFAARHAAADGVEPGDLCWGELTPVHWHVGSEQVTLTDPALLALPAHEEATLFAAVRELFVSEGFAMQQGAPGRWYVAHESLAEVAAASLDRVAGRSVAPWLAAGRQPPLVRRLLNEVQMLLHGHPLNAEREARGALPVNAVWLAGCGALQPVEGEAVLDGRLRAPAIAEDWPAWRQAFTALDGQWPREMSRLTLCGERAAATCDLAPRAGFQGWLARWQRRPPAQLLATL